MILIIHIKEKFDIIIRNLLQCQQDDDERSVLSTNLSIDDHNASLNIKLG